MPKDFQFHPPTKKLGVIGVMLIVILAGVFVCHLSLRSWALGLCGNEVFQEVYSPDNTVKVVVYERNCGATTSFSTQISILKSSEELQNKNGNIFIMGGHPNHTNIQVEWRSEQEISIAFSQAPGYEVFTKKEKYRDRFRTFTVEYRTENLGE